MNSMTLKGEVFSGEGVGADFLGISWARKQIEEKLGFDAYPGTLNIRIPDKETRLLGKVLKNLEGIEIAPARGFFRAYCFKTLLMNKVEGAIVIPQKPDYPSNVLEIIAPISLRKELSLEDSDEVEIMIIFGKH
jgi:riboflavin kinase